MASSDKFLVNLLGNVTGQHLFLLVWAGVSGFFVFLMVSSYRRATRRGFRAPGQGPGPRISVDKKRLGEGSARLPVKKD